MAANKREAGDVRLTSGPEAHGDLAYTYEIRCRDKHLHVRICRAGQAALIFEGSFEAAQHFAAMFN